MSLREIAAEMKLVAERKPYDMLAKSQDVMAAVASAPQDLKQYQRDMVIDNLPIRITYTLDLLPKRCWHLTIETNNQDLPKIVVAKVKAAFKFNSDLELPSLHGKRVRQFVKIIR